MEDREKIHEVGTKVRTTGVDSVLAALFQHILRELNINNIKFNAIMENYMLRNKASFPENIKDRASARVSLKKELLKATMTWRVFCKAMGFLCVKKFDIHIRLHHTNGLITDHAQTIVLDDTPIQGDSVNNE